MQEKKPNNIIEKKLIEWMKFLLGNQKSTEICSLEPLGRLRILKKICWLHLKYFVPGLFLKVWRS